MYRRVKGYSESHLRHSWGRYVYNRKVSSLQRIQKACILFWNGVHFLATAYTPPPFFSNRGPKGSGRRKEMTINWKCIFMVFVSRCIPIFLERINMKCTILIRTTRTPRGYRTRDVVSNVKSKRRWTLVLYLLAAIICWLDKHILFHNPTVTLEKDVPSLRTRQWLSSLFVEVGYQKRRKRESFQKFVS